MACRRRHGITRAATFKEEMYRPSMDDDDGESLSSASQSLAAQAIRASAAHRDSSLSSAYAQQPLRDRPKNQGGPTYDYTSMKSTNEAGGFWGVLARKAKAILDDDNMSRQFETPTVSPPKASQTSQYHDFHKPFQPSDGRKMENPAIRKGLDALTSSLNQFGGSLGTAFEEGRNIIENKTSDIIQETRKVQIRRKGSDLDEENQVYSVRSQWQQVSPQPSHQMQIQTNPEDQLKASRDVAMATAAKAKLLVRELKTVKADLTFAKQRCSQLEDENRILREAREKGGNPADDDMIRLQLETLLAEKARLANENAVYARENHFLREIVEYHQLTMQDVVYLDEGIEEVTEVYPIPGVSVLSSSPPSPASPRSLPDISSLSTWTTSSSVTNTFPIRRSSSVSKFPVPLSPQVVTDFHKLEAPPIFKAEGSRKND
ncbi:PREDICTED: uncharacterized protein LOC109181355 isoform X2 [Ipomoea nil]|uniref:uncharacterized protein LOC109181355 isoform X2 n=1 Tax=Ipomoea nil TaxID=35883 RepID=UPI000900D753|nr:PREDICTED: uncharacterized protein LOC109181355 isoform X2 [Ipomoea nil]